jgi:hypothetical protein
MLNRMKIILLTIAAAAMWFTNGSVFAEQLEKPKSKKYNLSVCSLFKNEAKYFKEWIEFHRLVGVEHFYLYNNGSLDNYANILNPYLKEGLITLVEWPDLIKEQSEEEAYKWSLSTQVTAYENAVRRWGIDETKWMVVLDVGEFLVPAQETNLKNILAIYEDYPGVILASDFYDATPANVVPNRRLVIEAVELTKAPKQNIQKAVEKMIFKPEESVGFFWPPFVQAFKNERIPVKVNRKAMRVNQYTNRKRMPWRFAKAKDKMHVDNRVISQDETNYWLEGDYEIEDQERAIQRFVPELLKKIGYDPMGS